MTLRECYCKLNGNYDEVIMRFRSEALVQRFMLKFLKDASFEQLTAALEQDNLEESFRAAHTLKGVCANLSFTKLQEHASSVTELLRAGNLAGGKAGYAALAESYGEVVSALKEFESNL